MMLLEGVLSAGILSVVSILMVQGLTQEMEYSSILRRKQEALTIVTQRSYQSEGTQPRLRQKKGHFTDGKEFLLKTETSFYPALLKKEEISVCWEQNGRVLKVYNNKLTISYK